MSERKLIKQEIAACNYSTNSSLNGGIELRNN